MRPEFMIFVKRLLLVCTWLLCVMGLFGLTQRPGSEVGPIEGMIEAKTYIVSSRYHTTVKKIHVKPGDVVHKDQLLIELQSSELEIKSGETSRALQRTQAQYENLASVTKDLSNSRLKSLQDEIQSLTEILAIYRKEMEQLNIKSGSQGLILSLAFHEGEKVSPHDVIARIESQENYTIRGYLSPGMTTLRPGTSVRITSKDRITSYIEGKVRSAGNTLATLPMRLQNPGSLKKKLGKELFIDAPEAQRIFHLGEKIQIEVLHMSDDNV